MAAKVHPSLLQQLDNADHPVQAIVQLRTSTQSETALSPEEVEKLAADVLARVAQEVGHPAARSNVLRNLGTIVVEAAPDFVRSLISQPEILSALPNQTTDSLFIPPTRRRPA